MLCSKNVEGDKVATERMLQRQPGPITLTVMRTNRVHGVDGHIERVDQIFGDAQPKLKRENSESTENSLTPEDSIRSQADMKAEADQELKLLQS